MFFLLQPKNKQAVKKANKQTLVCCRNNYAFAVFSQSYWSICFGGGGGGKGYVYTKRIMMIVWLLNTFFAVKAVELEVLNSHSQLA